MDWATSLGTVIGAIVGVGSSLATDRFRSHQDGKSHWAQTRREVYVDFLIALSRGHSEMRAVTFSEGLADGDRCGALHKALDDAGVWRLRQTLFLIAPQPVISLTIEAGLAIDGVRDALISEFSVDGDLYLRARADLWKVNAELRFAMREDLGVAGPPDPELGHYRYALRESPSSVVAPDAKE